MIISKDKFCNIIKHITLVQEQSREIDMVLRDPHYSSITNDFVSGWCISNPMIEQDLVLTLEDMFDDTNHWISYYIYELDCGAAWREGMITDEDGRNIPLQTPQELYDILTAEK